MNIASSRREPGNARPVPLIASQRGPKPVKVGVADAKSTQNSSYKKPQVQDERLKVVVRLLPPDLRETDFYSQFPVYLNDENVIRKHYISGEAPKDAFAAPKHSTAFILFRREKVAMEFMRQVKQSPMKNSDGIRENEIYSPVAEASLYQKIEVFKEVVPSGKLAGQPAYKRFLTALKAADGDVLKALGDGYNTFLTSNAKKPKKESKSKSKSKSKSGAKSASVSASPSPSPNGGAKKLKKKPAAGDGAAAVAGEKLQIKKKKNVKVDKPAKTDHKAASNKKGAAKDVGTESKTVNNKKAEGGSKAKKGVSKETGPGAKKKGTEKREAGAKIEGNKKPEKVLKKKPAKKEKAVQDGQASTKVVFPSIGTA